MSSPIAFDVARGIGNNLASGYRQVKDTNAIDKILSEAVNTGDPAVLQSSIGKILSQVSPERQKGAVEYLQNSMQNLQKRKEQERIERTGRQAATEGNYTYGAPPQVQAQQVKQGGYNDRVNQIVNPGQPQGQSQGMAQPQSQPLPNSMGSLEQSQIPQQPQSNAALNFKSLSEDQLSALLGIPGLSAGAKEELTSRRDDRKEDRADIRAAKKETLPLKQEIINRANASRESIRNKNHLIGLIDSGKLDDPTFAIFAENLPLGIGKRMLSPETVEYKGGLVDEFADLKNIFKGATRVKEVEIYENKLADLYLNDTQKKAILKSRINTAKVDLIREEAAAKVEENHPNISALQFSKKVDELAQPKINELFNSIWDEQKHVLDQAENRKNIPLDFDDPDDKQILEQILKEAGGNRVKAREIAKKKGYTIGK